MSPDIHALRDTAAKGTKYLFCHTMKQTKAYTLQNTHMHIFFLHQLHFAINEILTFNDLTAVKYVNIVSLQQPSEMCQHQDIGLCDFCKAVCICTMLRSVHGHYETCSISVTHGLISANHFCAVYYFMV